MKYISIAVSDETTTAWANLVVSDFSKLHFNYLAKKVQKLFEEKKKREAEFAARQLRLFEKGGIGTMAAKKKAKKAAAPKAAAPKAKAKKAPKK